MSQTFTDAKGGSWLVVFSVAELKRCKAMLNGHNPLDLFDDKNSIIDKLGDDEYLVSLLYAIVYPEIKAKNLDEEAFASLFLGEALNQARRAVAVALAGFFRDQHRRAAALAMVNKMIELEGLVLAKLDPLTKAVDDLDVSQLANDAYASLTSGAASSDSTPSPSP